MCKTHLCDVMELENAELTEWLQNHPKALSILFSLIVLLSYVGTAAAGNGVTYSGP